VAAGNQNVRRVTLLFAGVHWRVILNRRGEQFASDLADEEWRGRIEFLFFACAPIMHMLEVSSRCRAE
jgi:hypothetical protein